MPARRFSIDSLSNPSAASSWLRAALLVIPLAVSGCASLSEADCAKGNWIRIGVDDAFRGSPPSRFNDHVKACSKYGVQPDARLWQAGYDQGLLTYCLPSSGFHEGRYAGTYYRQCPAALEGPFLTAWQYGNEVSDVDTQISHLDTEINNLKDKAKDKDTSDDKRKALLSQIDNLKDKRSRWQRELDRLLFRAQQYGYVDR